MVQRDRPGFAPDAALPPLVEKRPQTRTIHAVALADDYAWLKVPNWQEVLRDPSRLDPAIRALLDAENSYAEQVLAPTAAMQKKLIAEMRARIKEEDSDVPVEDGPFLYYDRHRSGGEYPIVCRKPVSGGEEQILLDGDREAEGRAYFDLGGVRAAPDHRKLAWSADDKGSELYVIKLRDLESGKDRAETVADADGTIVWTADSSAFFYVRVDANHRTAQVFLRRLGSDPASDLSDGRRARSRLVRPSA